jgi:hypothetical protein
MSEGRESQDFIAFSQGRWSTITLEKDENSVPRKPTYKTIILQQCT